MWVGRPHAMGAVGWLSSHPQGLSPSSGFFTIQGSSLSFQHDQWLPRGRKLGGFLRSKLGDRRSQLLVGLTSLRVGWLQEREFPGGSDGKESAYGEGDPSSIPGLGRSPGEGNGNPLQYSCLGNSMNRGAWWATVHGVTKSQTPLND